MNTYQLCLDAIQSIECAREEKPIKDWFIKNLDKDYCNDFHPSIYQEPLLSMVEQAPESTDINRPTAFYYTRIQFLDKYNLMP